MSTFWASARSVTGVDECQKHTGEFCLVDQELSELEERPTGVPVALSPPNRSPFSDATEVFNGECRIRCLCGLNQSLADYVVCVASEVRLLSGYCLKSPFGGLGADGLQDAAAFIVSHTSALDVFASVDRSVRRDGQVFDTKVDSNDVFWFDRCPFWDVDRAEQVELAVAIHEIGLTFNSTAPGLLVLAAHERDPKSASDGPQTDFRQPLETQDALVVADCRAFLELRAILLVASKHFDCLGYRANSHLGGETELIADGSVTPVVDGDLAEDLVLKPNFCGKRGGGIEPFHCVEQSGFLFPRGEEFQLQSEFHVRSVPKNDPVFKMNGDSCPA